MAGGGKNRIVYENPRGWAQKRNDASRAGSVHNTQKQAEAAARKGLRRDGGGELVIKGENGRIRSKDTVEGGNESKVRDKEH